VSDIDQLVGAAVLVRANLDGSAVDASSAAGDCAGFDLVIRAEDAATAGVDEGVQDARRAVGLGAVRDDFIGQGEVAVAIEGVDREATVGSQAVLATAEAGSFERLLVLRSGSRWGAG
jgi:hypothetical protein